LFVFLFWLLELFTSWFLGSHPFDQNLTDYIKVTHFVFFWNEVNGFRNLRREFGTKHSIDEFLTYLQIVKMISSLTAIQKLVECEMAVVDHIPNVSTDVV
jgi:hypothetical protein